MDECSEEECVFEFPFVQPNMSGQNESRDSGFVAERLTTLTQVAKKLREAGWKSWFTLTGIAFQPPPGALDEEADDIEEEVAEMLSGLGIEEDFEVTPSRTVKEVAEVAEKLLDRVWYERKLVLVNSPDYDAEVAYRDHPDIVRGMLRNMQRVEQQGLEEEFPVENDFDWGMVNGKFSALRWLFGMEWDMLDT
jgi:hypothetical protein